MKNFCNYIINLKNLKHNYNKIKTHVGKNVLVCAMVKANAYGHGMHKVCKALKNADCFGVANAFEAKQIRKFNKKTKILVVGVCNKQNFLWCAKNNVDVTIDSLHSLNVLISCIKSKKINVHIKFNTGLNRLGFKSEFEVEKVCNILAKFKNINVVGVFSHLATKANDVGFIAKQHYYFKSLINNKKFFGHLANSFASTYNKNLHFNMVRVGYLLYGWQKEYLPVLSITSKIVAINNLKAGDSLGYDRSYVSNKTRKIGVVAIGYFDGLNRALSNCGKLLCNGKFVPIVGKICMDMCFVDLTNCKASIGDTITVLGKENNKVIDVDYYAKILNTTPYEVLTNFKDFRMNKIDIK